MSRLGRHDVGHEGVITGRDALSLRSSACSLQGLICDADPQGVTQPPLQSTYLHSICFNKCHPQLLLMSHFSLVQHTPARMAPRVLYETEYDEV